MVSISSSSAAPNNTNNQSQSNSNQQPTTHQTTWLNLIKRFIKTSGSDLNKSSSIMSLSDSAGISSPSDSRNQSPTDNFILDGFLKNNGGYLDDSDSEGSEALEEYPQNEINKNKHTIRVLAKKYQHEADSISSVTNPLIHLNFSKKMFKFNFINHSDHDHQHISTIINKPAENQILPKTNRTSHHRFLSTTRFDNDPLNSQQNRSNQTSKQTKPDQVETNAAIATITNKKHQVPKNNLQKLNKLHPFSHPHRNSHDINHHRTKEEDWNLNLKYIQSSTFPTKNTIIDPDHLKENCQYTSQPSLLLDNDDPHFKTFKSPFRNLVLGQDDLLRSN